MSYGQGIYEIADALYDADPAPEPSLRNSMIGTLLDKTPRHAWYAHPRLNPDWRPRKSADDAKFNLGSAAHDCLLRGSQSIVIVDADDWRTNAAKALRSSAAADGKIALLSKHWTEVQAMRRAAVAFLRKSPYAYMLDARPELTVIWQQSGAWCRAKLDLFDEARGMILDYKTTACENPRAFERAMPGYGYDTQQEHYPNGIEAVTGERPDCKFLVQEVEPPYLCYFAEASPVMKALAESKVGRAVKKWAECTQSGVWPDYGTDVHLMEPLPWAIAQEENQL